jgi:hypothetical protein
MKNNLLINLLVGTAIAGATASVTLSGCNDAKRDHNSPDGKSYNSEIEHGPGADNERDPQNTGGLPHNYSTGGNIGTEGHGTESSGAVGSDLPADTTRGSNNGPGKSTPADKTSTTKQSEQRNHTTK